MRAKYFRVLMNRLRSRGMGATIRQARSVLSVLLAARRGTAPRGPLSATLAFTYRCNQRCVMCNFPSRARRGEDEISTGRAREIILDLSRMGTSGVSFYGGEPLLRRDVTELVQCAHDAGMMVHIPTNGMLLTRERAEALLRAGVDLITLSMDGATAEMHDRQRGVPGAFEALGNAVRNVREARRAVGRPCHLALAATLTSGNADGIRGIIRAARDLGADTLSVFEAQDLADVEGMESSGGREALIRANEVLAREKKLQPDFIDNSGAYIALCGKLYRGEPAGIRCYAPYSDMFIDAYENVFTCNYFFGMNRPLGNLRGGSVGDFWRSEAYARARADLRDCAKCNYMCHRELSLALGRVDPFRRRGRRPWTAGKE